jgi:hypothetical protein
MPRISTLSSAKSFGFGSAIKNGFKTYVNLNAWSPIFSSIAIWTGSRFQTSARGTAVSISSDGISWTPTTLTVSGGGSFRTNWLDKVVTNSGAIILYNTLNSALAARSTDGGNTWTAISGTIPNPRARIYYFNEKLISLFKFVGQASSSFQSTNDGVSWSNTDFTSQIGNRDYRSMAYGNGVIVAPALAAVSGSELAGSTATRHCAYSTNMGISWSVTQAWPTPQFFGQIAFGNGVFVCMSRTNFKFASDYFVTSTDGINWTQRNWSDCVNYGNLEGAYFASVGDQLQYILGMFIIQFKPFTGTLPNITFINTDKLYFLVSLDGINWKIKTDFVDKSVIDAAGTVADAFGNPYEWDFRSEKMAYSPANASTGQRDTFVIMQIEVGSTSTATGVVTVVASKNFNTTKWING